MDVSFGLTPTERQIQFSGNKIYRGSVFDTERSVQSLPTFDHIKEKTKLERNSADLSLNLHFAID